MDYKYFTPEGGKALEEFTRREPSLSNPGEKNDSFTADIVRASVQRAISRIKKEGMPGNNAAIYALYDMLSMRACY